MHRWAGEFTLPYYLNAIVAVLQFSYTGVSSAVIKFLWCVDVGSARVVFSTPSMECNSTEYKRVLPLVVVALLCFVVGFLLAVAAGGLFRHCKQVGVRAAAKHAQAAASAARGQNPSAEEERHAAAVSAASAGLTPLYGVFRVGAWYWSSLVLCRRTLFVVLDVVLSAAPRSRSGSFTLANQASFVLSLYARPFRTRLLNLLDAASQLSLVVLSLLLTWELPPHSDLLDGILLAILIATSAAFIVAVATQQRIKTRRADGAPATSSPTDPTNTNKSGSDCNGAEALNANGASQAMDIAPAAGAYHAAAQKNGSKADGAEFSDAFGFGTPASPSRVHVAGAVQLAALRHGNGSMDPDAAEVGVSGPDPAAATTGSPHPCAPSNEAALGRASVQEDKEVEL